MSEGHTQPYTDRESREQRHETHTARKRAEGSQLTPNPLDPDPSSPFPLVRPPAPRLPPPLYPNVHGGIPAASLPLSAPAPHTVFIHLPWRVYGTVVRVWALCLGWCVCCCCCVSCIVLFHLARVDIGAQWGWPVATSLAPSLSACCWLLLVLSVLELLPLSLSPPFCRKTTAPTAAPPLQANRLQRPMKPPSYGALPLPGCTHAHTAPGTTTASKFTSIAAGLQHSTPRVARNGLRATKTDFAAKS